MLLAILRNLANQTIVAVHIDCPEFFAFPIEQIKCLFWTEPDLHRPSCTLMQPFLNVHFVGFFAIIVLFSNLLHPSSSAVHEFHHAVSRTSCDKWDCTKNDATVDVSDFAALKTLLESLYTSGKNCFFFWWFSGSWWFFHSFFIIFEKWFLWKPRKDYEKNHLLPENHKKSTKNPFFTRRVQTFIFWDYLRWVSGVIKAAEMSWYFTFPKRCLYIYENSLLGVLRCAEASSQMSNVSYDVSES